MATVLGVGVGGWEGEIQGRSVLFLSFSVLMRTTIHFYSLLSLLFSVSVFNPVQLCWRINTLLDFWLDFCFSYPNVYIPCIPACSTSRFIISDFCFSHPVSCVPSIAACSTSRFVPLNWIFVFHIQIFAFHAYWNVHIPSIPAYSTSRFIQWD